MQQNFPLHVHHFFRCCPELMDDFESELKFIHSSVLFFNLLIPTLRQKVAEGCDMDARHSAAVAMSFALTHARRLEPAGPLVSLPLALFSRGGELLKTLFDWDT